MRTLRKVAAIVLGVGMISAVVPTVVMAGDNDSVDVSVGNEEAVENVIYDDGYEITTVNGNITKVIFDGEILFTAGYDDEGNRIAKEGAANSTFSYEAGYLTAENRDGRNIEYLYAEKSNGAKELNRA